MNIGRNLALGWMLTGAAACDDENQPLRDVPDMQTDRSGIFIEELAIGFSNIEGLRDRARAEVYVTVFADEEPADFENFTLRSKLCENPERCAEGRAPLLTDSTLTFQEPDGTEYIGLVNVDYDSDLETAYSYTELLNPEGIVVNDFRFNLDLDPLPQAPEIPN